MVETYSETSIFNPKSTRNLVFINLHNGRTSLSTTNSLMVKASYEISIDITISILCFRNTNHQLTSCILSQDCKLTSSQLDSTLIARSCNDIDILVKYQLVAILDFHSSFEFLTFAVSTSELVEILTRNLLNRKLEVIHYSICRLRSPCVVILITNYRLPSSSILNSHFLLTWNTIRIRCFVFKWRIVPPQDIIRLL